MYYGEYPYDSPYIFSRGLSSDMRNFTGSYCKSRTDSGFMALAYSNNMGMSEQIACQQYIKEWKIQNPEKKVLRIAFRDSIGGQVMLKTYVDLLIIAKDLNHLYYYVFEYAGITQ